MNTIDRPLREIVTENFNSVHVLEKYGLDFCCNGEMSLKTACESRAIDPKVITDELSDVEYVDSAQRYFQWTLPFLIDYIVNNHHSFVREQVPLISKHLQKISRVHAEHHPEFLTVERMFQKLSADLLTHMAKEELILFPAIKAVTSAMPISDNACAIPSVGLRGPINVMMADHETAGGELRKIRELLHDYVPPVDACSTVLVVYKELEGFELDLHKHVFLENSVLFPKAQKVERESNSTPPGAPHR